MIKKTALSLLILLIFVQVSSQIEIVPELQEANAVKPGIEVDLSPTTVNNLLGKYIIPELNSLLPGLVFPDFDTKKFGVHIWLKDTKIGKLTIDPKATHVSLENNQVVYELRLENMEIDFTYKYKFLFLSSHHKGNVKIKWMDFKMYLSVLNEEGKIQIQTNKVETKNSKIKIGLGFGPIKYVVSKAMNFVVNLKFKHWRKHIQDIVVKVTDSLNNLMVKQYEIKPIKTVFDFTQVSDPEYAENSLKLFLNGYFYPVGKQTKNCNPRYAFEPIPENDDTKIFISKKSIYSLVFSIMKQKKNISFSFLKNMFNMDMKNLVEGAKEFIGSNLTSEQFLMNFIGVSAQGIHIEYKKHYVVVLINV